MTQSTQARGRVLLVLLSAAAACFAHAGMPPANAKRTVIVSSVDASGGNPTPAELKKLQEISDRAAKTGNEYYGKIIALLGTRRHPQAEKVTISFNYAYKGVAATGDNHTDVSATYALAHPDDIPGVIVHELTHVVQAYSKDTGYDTGWLTEGLADYVRWFNFEPINKRPHPRQSRHPKATGSYQTTAAFLAYTQGKYDKNLARELNEAMYDGTYTPDIWKKLTGKTLDELNDEWVATLEP